MEIIFGTFYLLGLGNDSFIWKFSYHFGFLERVKLYYTIHVVVWENQSDITAGEFCQAKMAKNRLFTKMFMFFKTYYSPKIIQKRFLITFYPLSFKNMVSLFKCLENASLLAKGHIQS